jgi:DNA replication protein DnaC
MSVPYPNECPSCIAKDWCKLYKGEVEKKEDATDWCSSAFRLDCAIKLSRIPPYLTKANIHSFIVDKENRELHDEILKPVVDNIVARIDEGNNFFFQSKDTGTGKTFSGAVLLNHYIYKTCLTKKFDFEKPLSLYVEYPSLIDDLRYRRSEDDVVELSSHIRHVPLLMLDDVGAGTLSDFAREQTYMILNYRMTHGLSTIVTTNLGVTQLENDAVLGKRIVSRMLNKCFGYELQGRDRRR